jgi:inner membrane transporter RhtA
MLLGLMAAIVSSSIPYSLEMLALKRMPEARFGVLLSMEPALGALVGGLLLGERLAPLQWLAIGLVGVASIGSVLANDRGRAAPEALPC